MEKHLIERFLNKLVGITIEDCGKQFFRKGYVTEVSEDSVLLIYGKEESAISLDRVKEIRSLKE